MTDSDVTALRTALLDWYDENRRDLPWRTEPDLPADPYSVWVSEVMLQQTRVDTVRPYFLRWMERFPTLDAVADAPLDDVLKAWEGLGYYSRARNLHRAAREVRERFGGEPPSDPSEFRALPGVGRYTAGAVMSIAFGHEEPVVDGNVRRVLARWLDRAEPTDAELWELAGRLVRGRRPGCFNQGLMELGSILCTPRAPRCDLCPVIAFCAARAAGTQEDRPRPRQRGPLPLEHRVAVVLRRDEEVLLVRTPLRKRLGGLCEFPGGPFRPDEDPAAVAERVIRETTGATIAAGEPIGVVDHTFTHLRVSYHALHATLVHGTPSAISYPELRWLPEEGLRTLALSKAQQRIAAAARQQPFDPPRYRMG